MGDNKEMTLSLRIKANMAEARMHLAAFNKTLGEVQSGGAKAFNLVGRAAGLALAPLKLYGGVAAAAAAGTVGMGIAALKAASDYEALQLRLEAVMGTEAEARKAFKETIAFANATPFEAGELINARILLEGIGIKGVPALKATAQAAAAMGRNVGDAAAMVASLETEPLRRLGISIKRDGDNAVFSFRDKMGKVRTIATSTADDARKALLGIFNTKFGGATDRLGGSLGGMLSTLKDGMTAVFAKVGEKLMPGAKQFIGFLNEELGKLVESDGLKKFSEGLGAKFKKAVDFAVAGLQELPNFFAELKNLGAGIGPVLKQAAMAGARVFVGAVLESWRASAGILMGLGRLLAGAFLEDILQMPFMSGTRHQMMQEGIKGMTRAEVDAITGGKYQNPGKIGLNEFSPAIEAKLAAGGREKLFQQGIEQASSAIPDALSRLGALATSEFGKVDAALKTATGGYSFAGSVRQRVADRSLVDEYTIAQTGASRGTINGRFLGRDPMTTSTMRAPRGTYEQGQTLPGGGVVINIQTLDVHANDVRELQNKLIKKSSGIFVGGKEWAPAGT